jgi:hypothetical protein
MLAACRTAALDFWRKRMTHDHSQHNAEPKDFWRSRYAIGLLALGAIAAYFLLSEHRAHFFGALPFLLLLACPLMHVFMHHGHGGHAGHGGGEQGDNTRAAPTVSKAPSPGEQP